MKFGTYLDYGELTCAGYPGSKNHLETDAKSLAEWEVDFVKVRSSFKPNAAHLIFSDRSMAVKSTTA
jgi:alpha-galactosidase